MGTVKRWMISDVETSGLSADAGVCEIAWREIDEDFNLIAKGYSLINPEVPISPSASGVNGISNEMVKDAPTIAEYMASVGYPFAGDDVVLCAHNSSFDVRFIGPWMDVPNTLCTLKCARHIYPESPDHKQATLAYYLDLGIDHKRAHSADGDIDTLEKLLKRMCSDANCTLSDLMELQKKPRKVTKLNFGKKHYGKKLEDVPKDYIEWMLGNVTNLDPDLKAALLAL